MNPRVYGTLFIAVLLAVDQVTKWFMLERVFRPRLGLGDSAPFFEWLKTAPERLPDIGITITSFFNFAMVWNEGISFGLMAGKGWGLLTIGALVITAFFFIWMLRSRSFLEITGLALVVGGALGNIYDRARFGAVADFLQFHWGNWYFPTFNVADSAISVGVAVVLVHGLFFAPKTQ